MLLNLNIKNYALIDNLDINFSDSFTAISGDTGSGKSIILDAISILLGARVDKKKINSDKCVIEASFKISSNLIKFFEKHDLDFDDTTIIRREINVNGKIRNFINDTPVTASVLSNFSSLIIEIHAQHHNLLIKSKIEQLSVIDKIANNEDLIDDYLQILNKYNNLKNELIEFNNSTKISEEDYILYKFHFQEINEAKIINNEEIELKKEIDLFENINDVKEITNESNHLLTSDNHVIDYLNKIKSLFSRYDQFDDFFERVNSSIIELNDIADELSNMYDDFGNNSFNYQEKTDRYDLINKILKKHQLKSSNEIQNFIEKLEKEINKYENFEKEQLKIISEINKVEKLLLAKSHSLTNSRNKIIPNFEKEIINLLMTLGMPHAFFKVKMEKSKEFLKTGMDKVIFEFSSNPGIKEQDISKIASGGEISRLVLALKFITSAKSGVKTIIFDEIDTGVSGKIASFMGDLMRKISFKNQLISVTHLPQIASKSKEHIKVFKTIKNNKTRTEIKILDSEERVVEIARLLSGKRISDAAITNAKELLNQ